jgi:glycosyltransferase involved in cell wall biosynthesis
MVQSEDNYLMSPEKYLIDLIHSSALSDLLSDYLELDKISGFNDVVSQIRKNSKVKTASPQTIAFLSYSLAVDDVGKVLLEQAEIFHKAGYQVVLITEHIDELEFPCPEYLPRLNLESPDLNFEQKLKLFLTTLISSKVDLVINHNSQDQGLMYFLAIARLLNIGWVQWIHHNALQYLAYARDLKYKNLINFYSVKFYDLATYCVCLSPFDVFMLRSFGLSRVLYIHNLISADLEVIKTTPAIIRTTPNIPARLLWVGRLDEVTKQISELPLILNEIVQTFPEIHLDIVGLDTFRVQTDLSLEFDKYGLRSKVTFHGFKFAQELVELYRKSDLLISTSISEANPNALWEACAYGMPIVMYELPWLQVTQNNLGCVQVPQRDREAFSRSVVKLLRDPKAYVASSQAMSAKFEQLEQTDITKTLLDLVRNRVIELVFTDAEQAEYAEIMARFIIYNSARNSRVTTKLLQQANIDQDVVFHQQADTIKVFIFNNADIELEKLRYQSQYKLLRALRAKAERIKRAIVQN